MLKLKTIITLAAAAALATAAMAQTSDTPRPNPTPVPCIHCNTPPATGGDSTAISNTLHIANAHADAGDARTLLQAQNHADQGDARTLEAATQHSTAQVTTLQKEAFGGIAQAAALVPMEPQADGETTLNVGAASYGGQAAIGLAISHQFGRATASAGVGTTGGKHKLVRVGLGWRF